MLIVITDRKDQLLQDTEATKPFGAKACLVFDQFRQKFGYKGNEKTLKWIRSFLEKYNIQMDLKMNRKSSLRKSWTNFKTSEVIGEFSASVVMPRNFHLFRFLSFSLLRTNNFDDHNQLKD